jgi:DNA-directed RNA polymerase subunit RPC12/RpoP
MMNQDYSITPKGEQYCLECGYKWIDTSTTAVFADGCYYGISSYSTTPTEPHERGRAVVKEWEGEKLIKNKVPRKHTKIVCPNCKAKFQVLIHNTKTKNHYLTCPKCEYPNITTLTWADCQAQRELDEDYEISRIIGGVVKIREEKAKKYVEMIEQKVAELKQKGVVFY